MRMWNVDPKLLCRKHLLGCHVEMHMFRGTIKKGISIQGYLENGLVIPKEIVRYHDTLAEEMLRRGYKHNSPLPNDFECCLEGEINVEENIKDLYNRCPECAELIKQKKE